MIGLILAVLSSVYQWCSSPSVQYEADWSLLPVELQEIIYKIHVQGSIKGAEFKRDIQRRWCDLQIKRLDRLRLYSKEAMDEKLEQLVWTIDSLPDVDHLTMLKMHCKINEFYHGYNRITLSSRWDVKIYDWNVERFQDISTRIGSNYLRGVVDNDNVFLGYILFAEERSAKAVEYILDKCGIRRSTGIMLYYQDSLLNTRASHEPQAIALGDARLRAQLLYKDRYRFKLKHPNGLIGCIVGRRLRDFTENPTIYVV